MTKKKVDPFEHTLIIPGIPELPEESTLIIKDPAPPPEEIKEPEQAPEVIENERTKGKGLLIWAAAGVVLASGFTWWFLGSNHLARRSMPKVEASEDPLPPSLQGYLDAAEHGDPKAMRMLGASYTYGLGVRMNKEKGVEWYRQAAKAGDKTAAQELKLVGEN